MFVLLGAAVAFSMGTGNFLGGWASKKSATTSVLAVVQACSLALAIVLVAALHDPPPGAEPVILSAASGLTVIAGLGILYRALSTGRMAVVAPISAATAASLPVIWNVAFGERPTAIAWIGVACALVAVVLIAGGDGAQPAVGSRRLELAMAIGSGLFFGTSFTLFVEASEGTGFWPVLVSRAASAAVVLLAALVGRRPLVPERGDIALAAGAGVFDNAATTLLLVAARRALVSLVAPVAALFPAATVFWARIVLGERINKRQYLGLGLAIAGLVLIAAG